MVQCFPVSPTGADILGVEGYSSVSEISEKIDTLTLYLGPDRLAPLIDEIISAKPGRVIFNPGTESAEAMVAFKKGGDPLRRSMHAGAAKHGRFLDAQRRALWRSQSPPR
ncbi:CoA-binding protein [Akkermansiaceae bacterium]|nr:CoA-binding protein [Akkermansiaceae bacterium]